MHQHHLDGCNKEVNDQGEPKMELTSLGEMWALESDQ